MIKVNLADAKSRLSQYLDSVERGETVILCRRNVPVAEIRPLPKPPTEPRPIGTDPDLLVPDSFFEPLPEDLIEAFEGGGADNGSELPRQDADKLLEQPIRQAANSLRAFYNQKNHPSHHEDLSNLSSVIARIQSPRTENLGALLASAEKHLLAALERRVGR